MPKQALYDLLARYPNMRHQHVEAFIREAAQLVRGCPLVPWHGRMFDEERAFLSQKLIGNLFRIKSPAAKAYLWLLMVQEERARNTREPFGVTDSELASGFGCELDHGGKLQASSCKTGAGEGGSEKARQKQGNYDQEGEVLGPYFNFMHSGTFSWRVLQEGL